MEIMEIEITSILEALIWFATVMAVISGLGCTFLMMKWALFGPFQPVEEDYENAFIKTISSKTPVALDNDVYKWVKDNPGKTVLDYQFSPHYDGHIRDGGNVFSVVITYSEDYD